MSKSKWKSMIMTMQEGSKEEIVHYETDSKNIVDWKEGIFNELSLYKGQPNGLATLDETGNIPMSQLSNIAESNANVLANVDAVSNKCDTIQSNMDLLVSSVTSDATGTIIVKKRNGEVNLITTIANSLHAKEVDKKIDPSTDPNVEKEHESSSNSMPLKQLNSNSDLNLFQDTANIYGSFQITGLEKYQQDSSGNPSNTNWIGYSICGPNGTCVQSITIRNKSFIRSKDKDTSWSSWRNMDSTDNDNLKNIPKFRLDKISSYDSSSDNILLYDKDSHNVDRINISDFYSHFLKSKISSLISSDISDKVKLKSWYYPPNEKFPYDMTVFRINNWAVVFGRFSHTLDFTNYEHEINVKWDPENVIFKKLHYVYLQDISVLEKTGENGGYVNGEGFRGYSAYNQNVHYAISYTQPSGFGVYIINTAKNCISKSFYYIAVGTLDDKYL